MIKFLGLKHKVTGDYIDYDYFLKAYNNDLNINFEQVLTALSFEDEINNIRETKTYTYKAKDILFSNDVEIIYEEESRLDYTTLKKIFYAIDYLDYELKTKVKDEIVRVYNKEITIKRCDMNYD